MRRRKQTAGNDKAHRLAAKLTTELTGAIPLLFELLGATHLLSDKQYVKTLKSTFCKNEDYWGFYYILTDVQFQKQADYRHLLMDFQRLLFKHVESMVQPISQQDESEIRGFSETSTGYIHEALVREDYGSGCVQRILGEFFDLHSSGKKTTISSNFRIEKPAILTKEWIFQVIEPLMWTCSVYEATTKAIRNCVRGHKRAWALIATCELTESEESGGEPKEPEATAGEPKESEATAEDDDPDSEDGERALCTICSGYLDCDRMGMAALDGHKVKYYSHVQREVEGSVGWRYWHEMLRPWHDAFLDSEWKGINVNKENHFYFEVEGVTYRGYRRNDWWMPGDRCKIKVKNMLTGKEFHCRIRDTFVGTVHPKGMKAAIAQGASGSSSAEENDRSTAHIDAGTML